MLVYDLEIGMRDWLVGTYDGKEFTQIHNDYEAMKEFYEKHAEDIWIGYNSANYDSIILKLILLNKPQNDIFEYSNKIVRGENVKNSLKKAYNLHNIKLYDMDLMNVLKLFNSLKELEGYLR